MALLQGLLAALFRSLGKILNTAFGWATIMLFGKVSRNRQIFLSLAAFGSVVWLIVLLGVAFPSFGVWLLSFMRPPAGVDPDWIRLGMLGGVVLLPLAVGGVSVFLFGRERRARRGGGWRILLRGYPYTLGLATTVLMMTIFAPVAKLSNIARRWTTVHVPIMIPEEHYAEVLADVREALATGGVETEREPAPWILRAALRILAALGGHPGRSSAAAELSVLRTPRGEILLHPADLVIGAPEAEAARIRAILATHLTHTRAYLTYTKEANEFEDEMRSLWGAAAQGAAGRDERAAVHAFERRLAALPVDFDEWGVLHRQVLLLDREVSRHQQVTIGNGAHDRVMPRALSAIGRRLLRAVARTVTSMLSEGGENVHRIAAVFERQDDADRAVNWLREQGITDEKISAVTKDRRAVETPGEQEPPGETVVSTELDGTSLSAEQIEEGFRRFHGRIQDRS